MLVGRVRGRYGRNLGAGAVLDVHRKQIKVYIKHLLKRTGYDKIKELR